MSVLSDIRHSKPFQLASDISVGHWIFTILAGFVPSGGAMLAHQPFWAVVLVFIVACAAAFAAIYFLGKQLNSLERAEITVLALVLIFGVVIWAATHPASKVTGIARATPTVEPSPAVQQPPPPQPANFPNGKNQPRTTRRKEPEKSQPTTGPITTGPCSNVQVGGSENQATVNCGPPPPPSRSIVENGGKMEGLVISDGVVTSSPNSNATALKTLPGSETINPTVKNVRVSESPSVGATEDPRSAAFAFSKNSFVSDELIVGQVSCGNRNILRAEGEAHNIEVRDSKMDDPKTCNWVQFIITALKHRKDMDVFLDKWNETMEQSWTGISAERREEYRGELGAIRKKLVDAAKTSDFQGVAIGMGRNPPNFEVKQP
ncbi:MAG TPA: hypothetical protein VN982_04750 [Candidatus Dormibacteraeota bacterium]|nr:hypothetical protein [Candidatus Dormibacteraeota bacterium]